MENLAASFADLLESTAAKIRSVTVDPAHKAITVAALAIPAVVLALFAIVFLFMTIHGALAVPLTQWGAYAVETGLFGAAGVLLWSKRVSKDKT